MALLENRRVLVTGGCGFVGRYVVQELYRRGYQVYVLDTELDPPSDIQAFYDVDLRDRMSLCLAVQKANPRFVVHLAAVHYIPYCNAHPLETYAVNVEGTHNLLEALTGSTERIFAASSAGVYSFSEMPHSEAEPAWPVDIYGFTKRAMELGIYEWSSRTGIRVVVGRYFNMYGQGETTPHVIPTLVEQVRAGTSQLLLGNTHTRRDFVHVLDNTAATCDLLETPLIENVTVNLGSGLSYSVANLVAMLSRMSERSLEVVIDAARVRIHDRPNLVADMTLFYELGLSQPKISLWKGLSNLLTAVKGPYL